MSNIKWASIQPLTGGAYFGAEAAFGHPAEFMISYPGFDAPKFDKAGNLVDAGNEYHLIKYLEKHNRMVPYYQFDRKPFQLDEAKDAKLLQNGVEVQHPDYSNIDLVIAVPVCSGLSSATLGAKKETLDLRNSNMMFLARYTLNTIKPKVYIFENAPRLSSPCGAPIREQLINIAKDAGYSVAFYRTDTKFHDNCQRRPRTFVYFFKDEGNLCGVPKLGFEHKQVSVEEFLNRIPEDATQNFPVKLHDMNKTLLAFAKHLYGDDWRKQVTSGNLLYHMLLNKKLDEWYEFSKTLDIPDKMKDMVKRSVDHIYKKTAMGMGYYLPTPVVSTTDTMPSAMFKTIPNTMHYKEDRLYTLREWMSTMGMPYDFEMYGDVFKNYPKIGQNVPARTAQFIVGEALKAIENWDSVERFEKDKVILFDNIKQTTKVMN